MSELRDNLGDYRERIVLRPQEISNHPEVIRRLGLSRDERDDRG